MLRPGPVGSRVFGPVAFVHASRVPNNQHDTRTHFHALSLGVERYLGRKNFMCNHVYHPCNRWSITHGSLLLGPDRFLPCALGMHDGRLQRSGWEHIGHGFGLHTRNGQAMRDVLKALLGIFGVRKGQQRSCSLTLTHFVSVAIANTPPSLASTCPCVCPRSPRFSVSWLQTKVSVEASSGRFGFQGRVFRLRNDGQGRRSRTCHHRW